MHNLIKRYVSKGSPTPALPQNDHPLQYAPKTMNQPVHWHEEKRENPFDADETLIRTRERSVLDRNERTHSLVCTGP